MDRLRSKERQIIDWFIQNFCGRINLASSSWTAWKSLIISFFESCDTIKQQYSRKGQLDIVREIDTIGPTLVKNILTVVEDSSYFPVSKFYKNKTLQFVQLAFEDYVVVTGHSSEIRGMCSMKCSSKTLQNLPYFWNTKTHAVFFVFHFVQLYIFTL